MRFAARYGGAILISLTTSLVAMILSVATGSDRIGVVFLAGVLAATAWLGWRPAILACVLQTISYYLIAKPDPAVPFLINVTISYLGLTLVTGVLLARLEDGKRRAEQREANAVALLGALHELAEISDEARARKRLAVHLARVGQTEVYMASNLREACEDLKILSGSLLDHLVEADRRMASIGAFTQRVGPWALRTLHAGSQDLGVVAWRIRGNPRPAATDTEMDGDRQAQLEILCDAGAIAIARAAEWRARARAA